MVSMRTFWFAGLGGKPMPTIPESITWASEMLTQAYNDGYKCYKLLVKPIRDAA